MTREPEREKQESSLAAMARYSGHGLTLALSMVLFLLLGWWADGKLGTSPVLTLIGAFVGAAAGFYSMLQHLILAPRAKERDEQERQRAAGGPHAAGGPADAGGPPDAGGSADVGGSPDAGGPADAEGGGVEGHGTEGDGGGA